jgi:hypothetical protein
MLNALDEHSQQLIDENRLWAAVILRAIADLLALETHADRTKQRSLKYRARTWLSSSARYPGSFKWICQFLDLDSERLRRRIFEIADNDSTFFRIANSCCWRSQLKAILAGEIEQGSEVVPTGTVESQDPPHLPYIERTPDAFRLAASACLRGSGG